MPQVHHEELRRLGRALLAAAGCDADEAGIVADHLVEANLKGHDSHGMGNLPGYLRRLGSGQSAPGQQPVVVLDQGPLLVMDGGRGLGQTIAQASMALAIGKAKAHGVCVLSIRNSGHMGRIGTYGEQCAEAGLASLHFVNVSGAQAYVAPFGAREPRYSTNPFCFAIPGGDKNPPVILDCATSEVAWGKLRVAFNKGEPAPAGTILGPGGRPTTDLSTMIPDLLGAMIGFGGHKGSGIALMCELFGAALGGGDTIQPGNPRDGVVTNNMLSILIDGARLSDAGRIRREVDAMVDYVRSAAPIDPVRPVMVAGDPERRSKAERLARGIPLDPETWRTLADLAKAAGVTMPAAA
jgi:uncharacterized oxidoreductase